MTLYIPLLAWEIIKEYMLDWKKMHQKLLNQCLNVKFLKDSEKISVKNNFWKSRPSQGIRAVYTKKCVSWNYDRKTKCIQSFWRIPWQNKLEYRTELPEKKEIEEIINNHDGQEWGTYYWIKQTFANNKQGNYW